VISGCVGPRADGYDPNFKISAEEAERYHAEQVASFAVTEADLVSALTTTNTEEAIGVPAPPGGRRGEEGKDRCKARRDRKAPRS
jgi:S-methylmethionine-dependent homocysteine/selenocysteine methylase